LWLACAPLFAAEPATSKFLVQREITARYPWVIWGTEFGETELIEIRKDELAGLTKFMGGTPWLKDTPPDVLPYAGFGGQVVANVNTPKYLSRPDLDIGIATYMPRRKPAATWNILGSLVSEKPGSANKTQLYQPWVAVKDARAGLLSRPVKGELRAERDYVGEFERFVMEKHANDRVALRFQTGYLSAHEGGGSSVLANRAWALEWEEWTIESNDDGTVILASQKGLPLRVGESPPYTLTNDKPVGADLTSAHFHLVPARDGLFALKTTRGTYVSAQADLQK
jgi:hypothetical protein